MVDRKLWGGVIIAVAALIAGAGALPSLLLQPEPIDIRFASETLAEPPPAQRLPLAEPIISEPVNIAAPAPPAPVPSEPANKAAPQTTGFPPVQPVGVEEARAPDSPAPAAAMAAPAKSAAEKQASAERARRKAARGVRPAVFPIREFLAWRR